MANRSNKNDYVLLSLGILFLCLAIVCGALRLWWAGAIAVVASAPGIVLFLYRLYCRQKSRQRMQRSIRRKLRQNHQREERLTGSQRTNLDGYGLTAENPVVMGNGIDLPRYGLHAQGIRRWLDDLQAEDQRPLTYRKVGSQVLAELYGQRDVTVDAYSFFDGSLPGRTVYATVYVCPEGLDTYLPKPPKGFISSGRQPAARPTESGRVRKPYYALLGIEEDATGEEIKLAYRTLAKQFHPDVAGDDPAAAEKMKQLNLAYATLSDPEQRRKYDAVR